MENTQPTPIPSAPPPVPVAPLVLETAFATDVGQVRELNEDTVWAMKFEAGAPNPWQLSGLLMVADGMGGHQAGEVASGLAGQTIHELFTSQRVELQPEDLTGQNLLERVSEAVKFVNRAVFEHGEEIGGPQRPGTTLTVALLRPDEWCVGHVGDSRAYLVRRNEAQQVTEDDSMVAEAVRRGHMTEAQARQSQFRNQITKAIGLRLEVEPSKYYGHWHPGDVLLLCSDGLTEYVLPHEIMGVMGYGQALQSGCDTLIEMANRRGGHDNISVAAARFLPTAGAMPAPPTPIHGTQQPEGWPAEQGNPLEPASPATRLDGTSMAMPTLPRDAASPSPRRSKKALWFLAAAAIVVVSAYLGWRSRATDKPDSKHSSTITVTSTPTVTGVAGVASPTATVAPEVPTPTTLAPVATPIQANPAARRPAGAPLFVALVPRKDAFYITSSLFNVESLRANLKYPVTQVRPNQLKVEVANSRQIQSDLVGKKVKLEWTTTQLKPTADHELPLPDVDGKVGSIRSDNAQPGPYKLRLSYEHTEVVLVIFVLEARK